MIQFKGRHFEKEIILCSVRWYVSYALSYRDIEEMMVERGISVDHTTLYRWVVHYSPLLEEAFRKRKKPVDRSWRMDETYIKVKGEWTYLYRAVDSEGQTVEFMLSEKRDKAAAYKFFRKALGSSGLPEKITVDKSGANKAALDQLNLYFSLAMLSIVIRQNKYLNNLVEQDHRGIKKITKPMMGFKSFDSAEATIAGIELSRMLKKGQMKAGNQPAWEQFYALAG